jgi:TDG/mug DNA glycosylase family protein
VTAYRAAFGVRDAVVGRQSLRLGGAELWVLANPSGLNAHETSTSLAEKFAALRVAAGL